MTHTCFLAVLAAVLGVAGTSFGAVSAPQRGFVSAKPAESWEQALVSGNGKYGAMVMGQPLDETIILVREAYARDPKGFDAIMKRLTAARGELASSEEAWLELEERREALAKG